MNVTEKFRIIILEGGDLCGKTTQAMELMKKFDNAIYFKFPTTKQQEKSCTNAAFFSFAYLLTGYILRYKFYCRACWH